MTPAKKAAEWMAAQVARHRILWQEEAAAEIARLFGDDLVYVNENGNHSISKAVLKEFRARTEGTVMYERSERYWRPREPYDPPGRRQAE